MDNRWYAFFKHCGYKKPIASQLIVILWFAASSLLHAQAPSATPQKKPQDNAILVIHSYHSTFRWTQQQKDTLEHAFIANNSPQRFHEFLDAKRFPETNDHHQFLSYLLKKYEHIPLGAIVVTDDPALDMLMNAHVFQQTPIIYLGINNASSRILEQPNMTGVFEYRDWLSSLNTIYALHGSDELIIITDSTQSGQANEAKIRKSSRHTAFKKIHYYHDILPTNLSQTLGQLDPTIPVFFVGYFRKNRQEGALLTSSESIQVFSAQYNNPVFSLAGDPTLDNVVGSHRINTDHHVKLAVNMVQRVLHGTPVHDIPPVTTLPNFWVFDEHTLEKYPINRDAIPDESQIVNQPPNFYQSYRLLVNSTVSVFLIALCTIVLLLQVIRRGKHRRQELQDNAQRYKDFAKAGSNRFWETDTKLRIIDFTTDGLDNFGIKEEDILGKPLSALIRKSAFIDFPTNEFLQHIHQRKLITDIIFKIRNQNDDVFIISINGTPIYRNDQYIGYRGTCRDVTEQFRLSQQVAYNATFDALTNLYNRITFTEKLESLLASKQQTNGYLCFIDLDNFKIINETAGHLVGDAMLTEHATRLRQCLKPDTIIGRVGGDEFGILLFDHSREEAQACCEAIIKSLSDYVYPWKDKLFSVGASIGIVTLDTTLSATEMLSRADICCNRAKEQGRGNVYFNDEPDELHTQQQHLGYVANISQALNEGRFYLCKQAIVANQPHTRGLHHTEVLIRYRDSDGTTISPAEFIPAAEKHGVIQLIDLWVVSEVLNHYHDYYPHNDTMISINLSALSLCLDHFTQNIKALVEHSHVPAECLCFEITETAVVSQMSKATDFIKTMRQLGVRFALDDFGSGACSYAYLQNLPVDFIKIDGSLIQNIETDKISYAIVESLSNIATLMGVETIAEYVETESCRQTLQHIGIDYVQGYGIEHPSPLLPQTSIH